MYIVVAILYAVHICYYFFGGGGILFGNLKVDLLYFCLYACVISCRWITLALADNVKVFYRFPRCVIRPTLTISVNLCNSNSTGSQVNSRKVSSIIITSALRCFKSRKFFKHSVKTCQPFSVDVTRKVI